MTLAFASSLASVGKEPQPVEFAQTDGFCEGPVFDRDGNLYVSQRDTVLKITPGGVRSTWLQMRAPNGHKILPDGAHLLCAADAVLRVSAEGVVLGKAAAEWNGTPLRAPNDLTLDRRGGFYFTDPGGSRQAPIGSVYHVRGDGSISRVATGLCVPNGLVLSPDGRKLYVSETVPNRVLWFAVEDAGRLGALNVLAELPGTGAVDGPDGMAADTAGNVYVAQLTSGKIHVLSGAGELLRSLDAGNTDASNLAWGGAKLTELYITGSIGHRARGTGRVFRLRVDGAHGVSALAPRSTEQTSHFP